MFRQQYTSRGDAGESNLFVSPGETDVDGSFGREARRSSLYTSLFELRPNVRRALAGGLLLGLFGGFIAWRSSREPESGAAGGAAGARRRR
jgi:hypothetical protein